MFFHKIKKGGTERTPKQGIVKVGDRSPNSSVAGASFGKKYVNMRVPLKISTESMKNANESGSEVLGFVHFEKHSKNDITHSME